MTDWEFICTIPILDGLEWELSYLMDHPELVGGVEEPVSGVVGNVPGEDDPSKG